MASLLKKLNIKKSLKTQIETSTAKGGYKPDERMLPYYELKVGEKIKLMLLPDSEGELWAKFKKHGPQLKVTKNGKTTGVYGVGSVNCAHTSSGDQCPACQKGFDYLNLEKETGDKAYREEAKKWFGKDYTLMSCIVLDSPFDVPPNPDGSSVKIINLPYKVEQYIINQVSEGNVPEDEVFVTPFYLKKTRNEGGFDSYETSYFGRKLLSDEEVEEIDESVGGIELYDYTTLDLIPADTSTADVQEWLDVAVVKYDTANGTTPVAEEEEEEKPVKRKKPTTSKRAVAQTEVDEEDDLPETDSKPEPEEENSEEEEDEAPSSALRDRLTKLRNK
jgi:hypothetical protein